MMVPHCAAHGSVRIGGDFFKSAVDFRFYPSIREYPYYWYRRDDKHALMKSFPPPQFNMRSFQECLCPRDAQAEPMEPTRVTC